MFAQLGSIQFSAVKGFTGFSTTQETNIVEHALIEGKPKLQRLGTNLDTTELTMMFDSSFCVPQQELDALNSSRELGEVMPLIMGNGRFVGNYAIRSVSDNVLNTADDGTLLQAEVTVSLVEYANSEQSASTTTSSIASAFANVNNNPPVFVPVLTPVAIEAQATQGLVFAGAEMNTAANTLNAFEGFVDEYRPKAEAVIQNMLVTGDQLNDTLSIINSDPLSEMYDRTRDLALKIGETLLVVADTSVAAQALITDIDNGNTMSIPGRVTSLVASGVELSNKSTQLSQKAASLISLVVVL